MRHMLSTLVLLLFASQAHAQQTQTLSWDYIGLTPTDISASAQVVTFNGSAISIVPTCTAKTTTPTGTTCSVPLPTLQPMNTASIALTRNGTTATTSVSGITALGAASASTPRLTINVTITLGS